MKKIVFAAAAAFALTSTVAMAQDPIALANSFGADCHVCHSVNNKIVGPAWKDVAARYDGEIKAGKITKDKVVAQLVAKVQHGGNGNWNSVTGGMSMVPHPVKPSKDQITQIVNAILALQQ